MKNQLIQIARLTLISGGSMLLFAATTLYSPIASAENKSDTNQLIARVRAATAKYHNPANAIAAGYLPTDECVPNMGYHYVKPSLIDLGVTEEEPELILYADSPDGLKLVAVEYFVPAITADSESGLWFDPSNPPQSGFIFPNPVLFAGEVFNGPMPGHEPTMPWHYDLHAWIWEHNPDGMFAPFNPRVSCNNAE